MNLLTILKKHTDYSVRSIQILFEEFSDDEFKNASGRVLEKNDAIHTVSVSGVQTVEVYTHVDDVPDVLREQEASGKYPGHRSRRQHVDLRHRVEEEIVHLNPRLEELAEGEIELISVDEKTGTVTLRIFGGRLH